MRIGFLAPLLWLGGQLWYGVQLPLAPNYTEGIDPCNLHRPAGGSDAHELALVVTAERPAVSYLVAFGYYRFLYGGIQAKLQNTELSFRALPSEGGAERLVKRGASISVRAENELSKQSSR